MASPATAAMWNLQLTRVYRACWVRTHPLRHRNLWGLEEEGLSVGAIRTSLVAPARKLPRVEIEHEGTEPERHRGRLDKTCSFPASLPGIREQRGR